MNGSKQQDQKTNQKIPWNKLKWGHNKKSVGPMESNPKGEIHSITELSKKKKKKKTRKSSNKHCNFTLKGTWERTTKPKWVEGKK